ncbi:MAG: hypothetical protein DMF56_08370 [Acidobacteria bacterium]|nr:MAG: hypothetical protein DMF56_08370 [Acidobacteriota bacterium]
MKKTAVALLFVPVLAFAGSKIVRYSMGGDIRVSDAPHGAVLRTMGGDIRVKNANGTVTAKTMGGDISVDRLQGSLDAGTMGGNVEVEVLNAGNGRDIKISSMGGRIEVTLPKDFAADFQVELEQDRDGRQHRIVSDFPLQFTKSTRHHWFRKVEVLTGTGKSGSGANHVRLWTIGSDITIRAR